MPPEADSWLSRGDFPPPLVGGEMSLDAAGKVCDLIAEFYGN
jgi:hypothetical protein